MRCIAIDDEPLALKQIESYISKTPFLELVSTCHSAFEAIKVLKAEKIDLMFVDINMPDLNGMDFTKSLSDKPLIVFTTAYSEYALEGFKVDAIDYLLKPISYADFLRAAERAYKQYQLQTARSEAPKSDILFVKSEYKTVRIVISDITHIESRSEYLRIYLEEGTPVMTLGNMKTIMENLPADAFARVHRSYIINLKKIASIERNHIVLQNKTEIPIGDQYKEEFRTYVDKFFIK